MDVRRRNAENFPLFATEMLLQDAVTTYARMRWPTGTAKHAAKEFDLTTDEGRGLAAGKPSMAVINKLLRSPNGGWAIALPVLGAVIGQGVDQFITSERRKHAQAAAQERALLRDLRALAPDRYRPSAELASAPAEPSRAFARRLGSGQD